MSTESVQQYIDLAVGLGINYAPKFVLAIITLIVGFYVVGTIVKILDKALHMRHVDPSLSGFLESLISIGLKALVVITVASMVGVQMTSFVAIIGAAGLAVGLSLQGSLSNFAGGVLILLFKPYSVGDIIEVAGHKGKVKKIDIFNTILLTLDNTIIVIPNGEASNGIITNLTAEPIRRVEIIFGIGYNDDIQLAKDTIMQVIQADERIKTDPEPMVAVSNLGSSTVDIISRCWVDTPNYWPVRFALNEQVKLALDAAGISIPFPQQDVHLYQHNSESS